MRVQRPKTPEWRAWSDAIQRCHNPKRSNFKWYGARGIRVCDEWRGRGGFARFLSHIGARPSNNHSLDRIDNNGHYEPGNVRWATATTQARNRRRSRPPVIEVNGETLSFREAARRLGLVPSAIAYRINAGWTPAEAATLPRGALPERLRTTEAA